MANLSTECNNDNLEDHAKSMIGDGLYNLLIKGYTEKQWQCSPKILPASIIKRLPVRFNFNNQYFDDKYQGIPVDGYTKLFDKMLGNDKIKVVLNLDFKDIRSSLSNDQTVIYTGPIDEFYDYRLGKLQWRSLDFKFETLDTEDFQGNSVINYADFDVKYTRIHEFKHLHPEKQYNKYKTNICYEYPQNVNEKYHSMYPVNSVEDAELFLKYNTIAEKEKSILFGGRLGMYKYFDMDNTILKAMELYENKIR